MEREQKPYINPEYEIKKIELERKLEEVFNKKIEAQQRINNLEEELEKTKDILAALEKNEQVLNQEFTRLHDGF